MVKNSVLDGRISFISELWIWCCLMVYSHFRLSTDLINQSVRLTLFHSFFDMSSSVCPAGWPDCSFASFLPEVAPISNSLKNNCSSLHCYHNHWHIKSLE